MKRLVTVVLVLVLVLGLLTAGVYADGMPWDLSTPYGSWKCYDSAVGFSRLWIGYSPRTVNDPYSAQTILRKSSYDYSVWASIYSKTATGWEYTVGGSTIIGENVYSGLLYGPAYQDPILNIHHGVRDPYGDISYSFSVY